METPQDRREPRRFEPPPWERERIDVEQPQQGEAAAESSPGGSPALGTEESRPPPTSPERENPTAIAEEQSAETGREKTGRPSESQMDAMVIGLSAEEGPASGSFVGCGILASVGSIFLGTVVLVYAVVVYARTASAGAVAVIGPTALVMTGAAILGAGVWLAVRTFNRRGA